MNETHTRVSRLVIDGLTEQQREMYEVASELWRHRNDDGVGYVNCGVIITRGVRAGKQCVKPAGQGTQYTGFGRCVAHGGAKRAGRALGAWLMAHKFAEELDCTPWEGLLRAVRIAAGRVSYCQWVIGSAVSDLELEGRFAKSEGGVILDPDTLEPLGVGEMRNRSWWVAKEELWVDRLAKYSKAAIDAGVAQLLLEKEIVAGEQLALVMQRTLDELVTNGVDDTVISVVRATMGRELRALDGAPGDERSGGGDTREGVRVIDGSVAGGSG
jgi:hypothetical protein